MPAYVCKHYRRAAAGDTTGALTNEISFSAPSAADAEARMRKLLTASVGAPMDWKKDFVTLEDDCGHILATWLHGLLHA